MASQMGAAARHYIQANFVGDLHLLRYAALFSSMLEQGESTRQ
jgi:hypothetical protein